MCEAERLENQALRQQVQELLEERERMRAALKKVNLESKARRRQLRGQPSDNNSR